MVGDVHDVITCAKFQIELFMGYDFTGDRIFDFPIDFFCCAACDFSKLYRCMLLSSRCCCLVHIMHAFWCICMRSFSLQNINTVCSNELIFCSTFFQNVEKQEAQLLQRDRALLHVTVYFAVTQGLSRSPEMTPEKGVPNQQAWLGHQLFSEVGPAATNDVGIAALSLA